MGQKFQKPIETILDAVTVTGRGVAKDSVGFPLRTLEILTAAFQGTLDIQGSLDGVNFVNLPYTSPQSGNSPTNASLVYAAPCTARQLFFLDPEQYVPRYAVNVAVASAGSVTVKVVASE